VTAAFAVEVRERLVHEERPWLAHDRAAQRYALALAARQLARAAAELLADAEPPRDRADRGWAPPPWRSLSCSSSRDARGVIPELRRRRPSSAGARC
jgi:hypothetical protein